MLTVEQLDSWFTYHPPTPEKAVKYKRIRDAEEHCHVTMSLLVDRRRYFDDFGSENTASTQKAHEVINARLRKLVEVIDAETPDSADKTTAIRCVRRARMLINEGLVLQDRNRRDENPTLHDVGLADPPDKKHFPDRLDHEAREALREARMWASAAIARDGK